MTMMLMANWSVFDPGPGSLSTIGRPPKGVAWPFWAQPAWRKKTAVINRLNRLWWRGSAMQVECTYWCITILHIFPIISRYFLHMKQILAGNWRPGGPRPFHRNLCFFFSFFWRKPCHLGLRPHHSSSHIGISYPRERCCHLWHALGDFMLAWDLNLNLAFIMTSPQPD